MHHVQNTCSDSILFTNEFRREHARTLISRTGGISSTHIDNWYFAPEKWHHKEKPKVCQHMEKWSRPPHPRPSTPFDSTLQTTCLPRSRHTERPRFDVKSSMSIARVGCGNFAWSMGTNPSNLVNTDILRQKKFCVPILTSEWRSDSAPALPHACGRPKRSQITFRRSFPISKREIVENARRSQSSSRSRTSQSNTWSV